MRSPTAMGLSSLVVKVEVPAVGPIIPGEPHEVLAAAEIGELLVGLVISVVVENEDGHLLHPEAQVLDEVVEH